MSTGLATPPATAVRATPRPIRWTCDQFHRLGDLGCFEGRRAMLIEGTILEQGPMNPPHAIAGVKTEDVIRDLFRQEWHIRVQKPLVFGADTDPEPDIAVLAGRPNLSGGHPSSAALVIEIADTSLKFDTTEKVRLYAKAGIPEYWVLDLNGRQLLVYRDPNSAASDYSTKLTLTDRDTVQPTAQPQATIKISDLLP